VREVPLALIKPVPFKASCLEAAKPEYREFIASSPVFDPETDEAPAPRVKIEVLAPLPERVTVPVLTVRGVVRVALVTEVAVPALPPIERLATGVVEVMTSGAVPVAKVEVICPEVVKPVKVPTEVNEEPMTVELRVVPVKLPAAEVIVIGAVPSKFTPLIARGVCRAVAVAALPPIESPEAVPVKPEPDPANPVAVKIPVDGMNDNAVEVVFCGRFPVLAVTQVG
jgi:hypothetical protein